MDLDIDTNIYSSNSNLEIEIEEFQKTELTGCGLSELMYGVVEGFYGTPWSTFQRQKLFYTMNKQNLNTYIYAPKDDEKHRKNWRIFYDQTECNNILNLIESARAQHINFVYVISPGLDIVYSSQSDREILKQKIEQVIALGASGVGLFLDDIEPELLEQDAILYESFSHAHVDITNYIYDAVGRPKIFVFCPTEYCSSRAKPSLGTSNYLHRLGECLHENIIIMWTGPRVVSRAIPRDHIKEVCKVLKRKPLIWDNLHANDYDKHQIFLGPFSNRPLSLFPHIKGFVLNPNCQYELNFIPILSFSFWVEAAHKKYSIERIGGNSGRFREISFQNTSEYIPEKVFVDCCKMWVKEFITVSREEFLFEPPLTINSSQPLLTSNAMKFSVDYDDSDDSSDSLNNEYNFEVNINHFDVYHVANFNYLPGQLGKFSKSFLAEFCWIKSSSTNFWQSKIVIVFLQPRTLTLN
uniref:protein O-GlcNAcase n=1 Tax=Myxobolus squamalis TaxID=59785 RepID=A0A6B2FXJ4_MYXSQ